MRPIGVTVIYKGYGSQLETILSSCNMPLYFTIHKNMQYLISHKFTRIASHKSIHVVMQQEIKINKHYGANLPGYGHLVPCQVL